MKSMIEIRLTNSTQRKVTQKYTALYRAMRRKLGRTYPRTKLIDNIRNALSIHGELVEPIQLKEPTYIPWKNLKYKVIKHNHWYYAIKVVVDFSGRVIGYGVDGLYEGDYHNDTMNTKPYESKTYKKSIVLTESKLRRIISESVRNVLNGLLY